MAQLKNFQTGTGGDSFNGPVGSTTASTGAFTTLSATGNVTLGDASTDTLNVGNGGLVKDASGNVGVGVTPSAWKSNYRTGQFGLGGSVAARSDNSGINISSNWYENAAGSDIYINSAHATRYSQSSGAHSWLTAASGTAGNAITFTTPMVLDANGNLGLGATSITPVFGQTFKIYNAAGGGTIELGGSTITTRLYASEGASAAGVGTTTNTAFQFITNNTERARIDSSGNLLVGKTSTDDSVQGTNINSNGSIEITTSNSGTTYPVVFYRAGSASAVGSISTNGSITAYNATSDYRLKTVVGAVTGQGARIDALEPIEYTWNSNGQQARGFLAHKFQEVYSDSVTGSKDAVDAEGNPVYQAMQAGTSEVIADLVAEIQSLRQRVAQLESN